MGLFAAAVVAVFHSSAGIAGGIGAGLGVMGASIYKDRSYLRLPDDRRAEVRRVMHSGTPSGDTELNEIALRKLRESARTVRSDRIVMTLFVVALIAFVVFAAVEAGLWALAAVPITALLAQQAWQRWRNDPRPRLARLDTATA